MGKRVFVVDDNPDIVKVMGHRLKKKGFDITGFTDGSEALQQMKSVKPDLVILD